MEEWTVSQAGNQRRQSWRDAAFLFRMGF